MTRGAPFTAFSVRRSSERIVASSAVVFALAGLLSGRVPSATDAASDRRTESYPGAATAKQQMIDAVDDATRLLGGHWEARTGLDHPEDCVLSDGEQGAQWRYLTGSTLAGDPSEDGAWIAEHWRGQGLQVIVRGPSDGPAVFASISAYAYPGNSMVQAVSLCFPGDADRIVEQQADE